MFDVFNEEIEVLIKDGLANLYWYKSDLHKAWQRSGVPVSIVEGIKQLRDETGKALTKRSQMDALYQKLRNGEYNRRLETSRNFVRILIEQETFTQQDSGHQVQKAQFAALRLKDLLAKQNKEQEAKQTVRNTSAKVAAVGYESKLAHLQDRFLAAHSMAAQAKGYELEKIFTELMKISDIPVAEPFRITGEQLDGAIKYEGRFYLVELKWTAAQTDPAQVGHFHYKLSGKMDGRGLFISMSGFTGGVLATLPKGKELTMMLLDGVHFANVLTGHYRFQQLLDHAIQSIALRGEIYCSHNIR
ncbi:restriction endonuclease [Paraburkholderia bonniea]|uniref:restriction endonuclease n=1 Tax=Paraburkholderia bonniea TaxID=2152891 RepID=UPI0025728307|nr:restriction endonuclease [Paraburkholderia bonniea]WJF89742.1 restriction endonuclease [Paraburkholderia bonniea]WJF93056.1 restriction endonuclease [Paraburkholderia bonniea]